MKTADPVSTQNRPFLSNQVSYLWREGSDGQAREYIDGGISRATVKDGRYLVAHNHFSIPLDNQAEGEIIRLSVYRANGEIILADVPLTSFHVASQNGRLAYSFNPLCATMLPRGCLCYKRKTHPHLCAWYLNSYLGGISDG